MTSKPASSEIALTDLAAALASLSPASLDAATLACARQRYFDTLGAAGLGFATPEGELLRRYAARVRGDRDPLGAAERCRVFVGAARTTEIDDIDIASCTTVGSVAVPVSLAVATAHAGHGEQRLPAAAVAGYEAITRLGRAIGGAALLYRGVWPTYVTAAFGAAATAAKLLDLDGSATARALALALSRTMAAPTGALARFGFRYHALGSAAADGADAAFAAAAGVEADLDGLASFAARLGAELDATELTAGLGERWRIQDVDTKPWPTSRQALASVAAFLELVPQLGALDDVERIEVRVPAAYRDMIDRPALPTQRIESMIGVQYQLGLAAFAPETLDDALRSTLPADPRIAALMGKTQVLADGGLSAEFPRRWGSTVTLRRRSGRATTIEALEPALGGTEPPTWTALSAKLARIFAASGRPCAERLAALRARCERIGIADDAGIAAELLASTERLGERAEPRAS